MKRLLFIYNLHSGKGLIRNHLADIIDTFNKAGYETVVYSTQERADATRLAKELGASYDLVVCSGGDGTLSEVLDGVMTIDEKRRPKIGYIPAGSTNDYAYSLGLPSQMKRCANVIAEEKFRAVDVGKFQENSYFVYVAAFGAFTEVSWNTPQKTKNALGHNAGDEEIAGECIYAMVYNSFSVGGMKNISGQNVELDDGKLNLMIVYRPDNAVDFSVMLADLVTKNPNSKFIANYEISDLIVESDSDIDWVLDGEYGGSHKKVHIQAIPQAMKIAVPAETIPQEK